MTTRRKRQWLRAGAVLVALLFVAGDALARGGRGGGGGGRGGGGGGMRGGGISRSSPASGGLGSMQRARSPSWQSRPSASTRPATTRPATANRPGASTRPGGGGQGQRPDQGAGDRQKDRQDTTKDRQDNRLDQRDDAREDWQDYGNEAREDRQDHWDDDEWSGIYVHDDDEFEWNSGTWLVLGVGTAVTVTAFSSMREQPACNLFQTEVDGTVYYKCGSTWYIEAVHGDEVRYVAVEPPPGF